MKKLKLNQISLQSFVTSKSQQRFLNTIVGGINVKPSARLLPPTNHCNHSAICHGTDNDCDP